MRNPNDGDDRHGSNVAAQPNVAPREQGAPLEADSRFRRQIRGRMAIVKYLNSLGYNGWEVRPSDVHLVRKGVLTGEQLDQIAAAVACVHCKTVPVGTGWRGEREFRCERSDCPDRGGARKDARP